MGPAQAGGAEEFGQVADQLDSLTQLRHRCVSAARKTAEFCRSSDSLLICGAKDSRLPQAIVP
jgi:hypothetical protein